MISFLKRSHFRRLCENPLLYNLIRGYSGVSSDVKIQIPKRIERSSTDILEALAKTVRRDPTAHHYKFPDDPHFDIQTQGQKRSYALAKEAGRKAAWWVVEQHPELFQHEVAEPRIEAFFPAKEYTNKNSNITVLTDLISNAQVSNAIKVYNILKEEKIDVDDSLKIKLLELCCFYNSEDMGDERLVEEKWYFNDNENASQMKTWKSNGFAEELFLELENDPKAICAMIQGRLKYYDVNGGYDLYSDASNKGVPLTTAVYNGLISVVDSLKQSDDERWKLTLDFLREMNERRIPVDLGTLNAALKFLSNVSRLVRTEESVLPLLAEFKRLNIEPSLGSYYYILKHFHHKQKRLPKGFLPSILTEIDGKEHEIRHESDVYFFTWAMNLCNHQRDLQSARKLNDILNIGQNYKFLSNDLHETRYFRDYVRLVFLDESIDIAMETYQALVPRFYAPDYPTLESVIEALNKNGATEYFPDIWNQLISLEGRNTKVYETFLQAIISNPPEADDAKQFYTNVADKIYFLVETKLRQERSTMRWTSPLISSVLTLYVRAKDFQNSKVVFQTAERNVNIEIDNNALVEFLDLCFALDKSSQAIECLKYAHERSFLNSTAMAKRIRAEFLLDDKQSQFVSSILDS